MASNTYLSNVDRNILLQMKNALETNGELIFKQEVNGISYDVHIVLPKKTEEINIPYVLAIPENVKEGSRMAVESNNCDFDGRIEQDSELLLLKNSLDTANQLSHTLQNDEAPILIPILPSSIPSNTSSFVYFQQLAEECFKFDETNPFYRLDLQVKKVIEDAKMRINTSKKINVDNKIFLNGYSSSGVFAQRFALLHPEIIDTLCIGGASGSIPFPTYTNLETGLEYGLDYPLGTKNYENLFGTAFNEEAYKNIKFRYFVGELEDQRSTKERKNDFGFPAPMHDMSYFDASIPTLTGKKQREMFGENLFDRAKKQVEVLAIEGYDITHEIIPGRGHNNVSELGITGVNELGDEIVSNAYSESIGKKQSLSNK